MMRAQFSLPLLNATAIPPTIGPRQVLDRLSPQVNGHGGQAGPHAARPSTLDPGVVRPPAAGRASRLPVETARRGALCLSAGATGVQLDPADGRSRASARP